MGILAVLLLGLTAAATVSGQKLELKRSVLANGMTVIVHEDHDIPTSRCKTFFKVGGRNEHPGHNRPCRTFSTHDVQRSQELRPQAVRHPDGNNGWAQ